METAQRGGRQLEKRAAEAEAAAQESAEQVQALEAEAEAVAASLTGANAATEEATGQAQSLLEVRAASFSFPAFVLFHLRLLFGFRRTCGRC